MVSGGDPFYLIFGVNRQRNRRFSVDICS